MLAKSSWTMKSAILVVIITALVSCLVAGCGSDREDKDDWNGFYYYNDQNVDTSYYESVEVAVEDGFMMVTYKEINEDYTSEYSGDGNYKESKNGKTISVPFDDDYSTKSTAELISLSGKYYISFKYDDGTEGDKFELKKYSKKQPESTTSKVVVTTTKVEETTTKKPKKVKKHKKKSASVSSDFKETLDDYEDFIDDYVAFMKKYKKAGAAEQAGMLTDYSEMMSKYSELSSEMSNMKSNLSSDELAYYTKVMSRVAKKLSKVS